MKRTPPQPLSPAPASRLPITALIALTLLAMHGVCANEFSSYDDYYTIVANPDFNPPTVGSILSYWTRPFMSLYVPVTFSVWGAVAFIARTNAPDALGATLNPWIYHTLNLVVHLITVALVYRLLRRLLKGDFPAFAGAAIFAVHPVQVETIAWASGTKDLLGGMFAVAALLHYVESVTREDSSWKWHRAVATACFILAMLSKPGTVVVPLLAVVIDRIPLNRPLRDIARTIAPWLLLMIPFLIITRIVQSDGRVPNAPPLARPFVAADAIVFYLRQLLFPIHLTFDYARSPLIVFRQPMTYILWIIPVGLAIALWRFRRQAPHLLTGALLFVIALGPMLGLVTFHFQYYSTVSDHYLYLPMLGIALIVGWIVRRFPHRATAGVVGVLLLVFTVKSALQTRVWSDDLTLFTHATAVSPESLLAHNNLGMTYFHAGDLDRAEAAMRKAIAIRPDREQARNNLERILSMKRRLEERIAAPGVTTAPVEP